MNKRDFKHQSNLAFREFDLPAGGEWRSPLAGWNLMFVRQGSGYFLQPRLNLELETGALLLLGGQSSGSIRASQLGALSLCSFRVIPERLTSLITLPEQCLFRLPPDSDSVVKVLPPDNPVATGMCALIAEKTAGDLSFRLKLLQLFVELFEAHPVPAKFPAFESDDSDAMKRLQGFLKEMPASELMELEFGELAAMTHCTPRHLSRIFHKLVGMSFSDKRAELRLARAEELLSTSSTKVVQVALESGYNSLSQFNLMFIRRYGMSPGRWREKHGRGNTRGKRNKIHLRFKPAQAASTVSPGNFSLPSPGKWPATGGFRLS